MKNLLLLVIVLVALSCGGGGTSFNDGKTVSSNVSYDDSFLVDTLGTNYNLDKGVRRYDDNLIIKRINNVNEFKTYLSVTGSDQSKADKVNFNYYYVYYLMFKQVPTQKQSINIYSTSINSSNVVIEYFYTSAGNSDNYYFTYEAVKRVNEIHWIQVSEVDFQRLD
jgi:hypothetical protein